MAKFLNTNFFSYSVVFFIFFIFIFLLVTPDKSFAQTNCTTFVIGVGSPPCETPAYNRDCTMSVGFPFGGDYVTGDECAANFTQVCVETKSLFNWTGERCDPTPTPTPIPPTPTPTIIPCGNFTSCDSCIFAVNNGGPNNCGWNGGSCEAGTASCPVGYSQWYWTTCAINECTVPTLTPTPTP